MTTKNVKGFSLVELLVSITVGVILMTGVVQMFVSSKTVFVTQEGISRVQETGRLAVEFLSYDIRQAGYMGCFSRQALDAQSVTSTLNGGLLMFDFLRGGIEAFDGAPPGVDFTGGATPVAGIPSIILRGATRSGVSVVDNNDAGQLFVSNFGETAPGCFSGLCDEDVLIVTDCSKARIFQASNVQEGAGGARINVVHSKGSMVPGNSISSWGPGKGKNSNPSETFGPGAEIIKMNSTVYYIGESPESGRRGLWIKNGAAPPFELLEGVEDMNLTFAVDANEDLRVTDGDFVDLADVAEWKQVVAVRVELLVQSTDETLAATTDKQTYTFGGVEVDAEDNRIRQVFTSTIGIRTRLN